MTARWVELDGRRVLAEAVDGRYALHESWATWDEKRKANVSIDVPHAIADSIRHTRQKVWMHSKTGHQFYAGDRVVMPGAPKGYGVVKGLSVREGEARVRVKTEKGEFAVEPDSLRELHEAETQGAKLSEGLHLRIHFKDGRVHRHRIHGGAKDKASKIARRLRARPDVAKVVLAESWEEFDALRKAGHFSKAVKTGPLPGQVIDSPGRGPTGKIRNFGAMSSEKLAETLEALKVHGQDPEAHKAAMAAAVEKLGVFDGEHITLPSHVGKKVGASDQLLISA